MCPGGSLFARSSTLAPDYATIPAASRSGTVSARRPPRRLSPEDFVAARLRRLKGSGAGFSRSPGHFHHQSSSQSIGNRSSTTPRRLEAICSGLEAELIKPRPPSRRTRAAPSAQRIVHVDVQRRHHRSIPSLGFGFIAPYGYVALISSRRRAAFGLWTTRAGAGAGGGGAALSSGAGVPKTRSTLRGLWRTPFLQGGGLFAIDFSLSCANSRSSHSCVKSASSHNSKSMKYKSFHAVKICISWIPCTASQN